MFILCRPMTSWTSLCCTSIAAADLAVLCYLREFCFVQHKVYMVRLGVRCTRFVGVWLCDTPGIQLLKQLLVKQAYGVLVYGRMMLSQELCCRMSGFVKCVILQYKDFDYGCRLIRQGAWEEL